MTPRQGDVIVALSIVGVGIAGLVSGLLGHPTALSLAFAVLFVLIPLEPWSERAHPSE